MARPPRAMLRRTRSSQVLGPSRFPANKPDASPTSTVSLQIVGSRSMVPKSLTSTRPLTFCEVSPITRKGRHRASHAFEEERRQKSQLVVFSGCRLVRVRLNQERQLSYFLRGHSQCLLPRWQWTISFAIRHIFLPAHRSERPLQHAADAHGRGTDVESHCLLVHGSLRLCRSVALAQIIEPRRAVIALRPKFGIDDITRDRPAIGAVALT